MVSLVESWESLGEYAKWCRTGAYQLRETVDGIELRVAVGRYGFIKCFRDTGDPLFSHILEFLKMEGYIRTSENQKDPCK